jgi:hypothetical protein
MLELAERSLDLTCPCPHRAGHPVERPQLIEDGAFDPVDGVCLELVAPLRLELVDGVDEPEGPVRRQIGGIHALGKPRPEPAGDELHERGVVEDEALTCLVVAAGLESLPELSQLFFTALMHVDGFAHTPSRGGRG